jgi:hypothetical protein
MSTQEVDFNKVVADCMQDKDLPRIYANGFMTFLGNSDAGVILQLDGRPLTMIHMSYTLAKTLCLKLGEAIEHLEKQTRNTIMTTDTLSGPTGEEGPQ